MSSGYTPEVVGTLRRLIVETANLDIAPEAVPESGIATAMGIDSVTALEYLLAVEAEFDIFIPDEDLSVDLVDSFATLANLIESLRGASVV